MGLRFVQVVDLVERSTADCRDASAYLSDESE